MATSPKSPESIAEELSLAVWRKIMTATIPSPFTFEQFNERFKPIALEAMRIQREQDAQMCESNFKPEDDCEFECHRADAAAIRGVKP